MMKIVDLPIIENNELKYIKIFEKNGKFAYGKLNEDGKLIISNKIEELKKLLNPKYLPLIKQINPNPLYQKAYEYFSKNYPQSLSSEEIKQINPETLTFFVNPEEKEKAKKILNATKFNFTDTKYRMRNNYNKRYTYFQKNKVERGIAEVFSIPGKITFLIGVTGTGKTYSTKLFAKTNDYKFFSSTVSFTGDVRESVIGRKTLETTETGEQKIVHIPGAGLEAFREITENKKECILFLDEVFRGSATDLMTMFSLKEDEGELFYELEGVEYYYIAEIENLNGERAKILLAQDRNVFFDKGKILKAFPTDATKEEIIEAMKNGNISKVTRESLEKYGYKIIDVEDKVKEAFVIPENMLKIVLAGNIGEEYDISSQLDSAVLSRAGIVKASNKDLKPEEMLMILKRFSNNDIPQDKKEMQERKENFIIKFFYQIRAGMDIKEINLPERTYTMRNMQTLLNVQDVPNEIVIKNGKETTQSKNIEEYLTELIENYFLVNYVDWNIGKENIEPNQTQKKYIQEALENILKEKEELKIGENFDFDKDVGSKPKAKLGM